MAAYTPQEINVFEHDNRVKLPDRLCSFLRVHGPGHYEYIEIYSLDQIYGIYADFFDDPTEIFSRWLPFGCNNNTQELWVLDLSTSSPKFAKIWHETVPDAWDDENWVSWSSFADATDSEFDLIGM
jgi:hypothetical protein